MGAETELFVVPDPLAVSAINGGAAANGDIAIQGTTNATRTTSTVQLQPNGGGVTVGNVTLPGTAIPLFEFPFSTTLPQIKLGSMEGQSHSLGASWLGDNVYFDGTNWKSRAAGRPVLCGFSGGNFLVRAVAADQSAGASFTPIVPFIVNRDGSIGFGGDVSAGAGLAGSRMALSAAGGLSLGASNVGTDPGAGRAIVALGGSTSAAKVGGNITTDTTQTGNITTGEDTLQTFALPASSLSVNGDTLEFKVFGTIANTAATKRIRVKFGGTTFFDTGAVLANAAVNWSIEGEVVRTGAATQKCVARLSTNNATVQSFCGYSTAAETLSNAINIVVTGEATNTNDIVKEVFKSSWTPP